MAWTITYYSSRVERAILRLPKGLLARYLRLTDLIGQFGPDLGMPHTKHLGSGLIELRVKGVEGIARVFYCARIGNKVVMLHCFVKKDQKTPRRELQLARKRLKEIDHDTS